MKQVNNICSHGQWRMVASREVSVLYSEAVNLVFCPKQAEPTGAKLPCEEMYSKGSTTTTSPVFSHHSQMSQVLLSPLHRLGKLRPHNQQAVEADEHPHPPACKLTHVLGQEESGQCTRESPEHTRSWWCLSPHCLHFLNTLSVTKELNCWWANRQHIAKLPNECIPSTWGVGIARSTALLSHWEKAWTSGLYLVVCLVFGHKHVLPSLRAVTQASWSVLPHKVDCTKSISSQGRK